MTEEEEQCRYCYERDGELLKDVCKCRGTMASIHWECLRRGVSPLYPVCTICKGTIAIPTKERIELVKERLPWSPDRFLVVIEIIVMVLFLYKLVHFIEMNFGQVVATTNTFVLVVETAADKVFGVFNKCLDIVDDFSSFFNSQM